MGMTATATICICCCFTIMNVASVMQVSCNKTSCGLLHQLKFHKRPVLAPLVSHKIRMMSDSHSLVVHHRNTWITPAIGTVAAATLATVYPSLMVPAAVVFVTMLSIAAIARLVFKQSDGSKACINAEQVLQLVRTRRSVFPKDYTGE
jgi:hypothetical protein